MEPFFLINRAVFASFLLNDEQRESQNNFSKIGLRLMPFMEMKLPQRFHNFTLSSNSF